MVLLESLGLVLAQLLISVSSYTWLLVKGSDTLQLAWELDFEQQNTLFMAFVNGYSVLTFKNILL